MVADETTYVGPFRVGDVVRMKDVPAGIADVTVKAVDVCAAEDKCVLGSQTIIFDDPASGEEDESHASQFDLVKRTPDLDAPRWEPDPDNPWKARFGGVAKLHFRTDGLGYTDDKAHVFLRGVCAALNALDVVPTESTD